MNINQKDIMKTAASHLRSLSAEVKDYREKEAKRGIVEGILMKTADVEISPSEFFEKYSSYMEKDLDELKIVEKAIELTKTGEISLGSLSAQPADNGELDPLTALLVDDYLQ